MEGNRNAINPPYPYSALRISTYLATGLQFGVALRLSNLSEFQRVFGFLLLPFHSGFDYSLAFVAGGALSLGALLYNFARAGDRPRFADKWTVSRVGEIDTQLLVGSAIFGVGWGLAGICREFLSLSLSSSPFADRHYLAGPALVNFGRALGSGGQAMTPYAVWLASMVAGGLLA